MHIKIAKINLKLKHAKQESNQCINKIISYVKKLKIQSFKFSKKYQEYSPFFCTLYSHVRKTMLKNHFEVLSKRKLKKLIWRFEHTKIFFEKNDQSQNLILRKSKKKNFSINNSSMSRTMTVCRMRAIKTIIKIKAKIVNIVKTKFRAIKQRNLKIIILLIYQK